jgi:hypothetical protein
VSNVEANSDNSQKGSNAASRVPEFDKMLGQEVGFRIGLAIVLMLMIFATFNDIVHLATS